MAAGPDPPTLAAAAFRLAGPLRTRSPRISPLAAPGSCRRRPAPRWRARHPSLHLDLSPAVAGSRHPRLEAAAMLRAFARTGDPERVRLRAIRRRWVRLTRRIPVQMSWWAEAGF